jgi:hypothetical protein
VITLFLLATSLKNALRLTQINGVNHLAVTTKLYPELGLAPAVIALVVTSTTRQSSEPRKTIAAAVGAGTIA